MTSFSSWEFPSSGGFPVTSLEQKDTEKMSQTYSYKMNHPQRGKAIIFNQNKFDRRGLLPREFSDVDCSTMYVTLKSLKFSVESYQNLQADKIEQKLLHVSQEDHSDADCFVCVILSYGDQGAIYAKDRVVQIDYIMEFFKGDRCPTLAGKPKIFIFQACNEAVYNFSCEEADSASPTKLYRIPAEANFLMVWSLVPGRVSWRTPQSGSMFIAALCQMLKRNPEMELQRLLTNVVREVAYELEKNCPKVFQKAGRKLPCVINMLTKQVFLAAKS